MNAAIPQASKFLDRPILFLIFNRPEQTAQVFEAIRLIKPSRLYVASDGPRFGVDFEDELVAQCRAIASAVDWSCEVKHLFRDRNLGCKHAVSQAISWFFEHEEAGIILEDDCLPSQSFFSFCDELLTAHMSDDRIFMICGYNWEQEWKPGDHNYFFSNLGGVWGWASWRRAWAHYDSEMLNLEILAKSGFFERTLGKELGRLRKNQLLRAKKKELKGEISSWAYAWGFSRNVNQGLACVPSVSLIANIGFGQDATHTRGIPSPRRKTVVAMDLEVPLKTNHHFKPDINYDERFLSELSRSSNLRSRLRSAIKYVKHPII